MPKPSRLREKLFMEDFQKYANKDNADTIFGNLGEENVQKDLQHLDEKVKKAKNLINNIEKIPENVFKLIEDLYDKEEITINPNSCEYSNGVFRAKTTKDFRHHKKSNPDYWTAINMLFTTNEVAYLIAGMEYYHLGRLDEYIDKAENLDLFIGRTMSDFCKYSPKEDNYTIEGSILESRSFSRNNEKGVFVTIVFKLLNSKGDLCSYSEVHFYDRKGIEYRNAPKFLSKNIKNVTPKPSRLRNKWLFMSDIENLGEGDTQKDEKVKKAKNLINNIEKIPENVFKLIEDLYDKEEITINPNSCEYSNGVFRAKTTKDFRHHKKSNPDYWTAINMLFTTNEVAYLIAGMEYYHLGRLDEYIDKAENLDLFIGRTMSDFCKYSPKEDNYTIEGSILESRSFSRNNEKGVFVTIAFKLLNSKGDLCSYSEVHFYDRKGIEYRNAPKFLSENK